MQGPERVQGESLPVGGSLRVLVVDDDVLVRETLREIIQILGYEAEMAGDGPSALDIVEQQPFDVVITDLGMPRMSGWQVAERVKQLTPGTEVFILTGWGDSLETNQRAYQVLTKPVEIKVLGEILARARANRVA